jgi:hypothetical protein
MKLLQWIYKLFSRKNKTTEYNVGYSGFEKDSEISYYSAKYFQNDLDNENDYYLEVRKRGDNKFVRKDEVD